MPLASPAVALLAAGGTEAATVPRRRIGLLSGERPYDVGCLIHGHHHAHDHDRDAAVQPQRMQKGATESNLKAFQGPRHSRGSLFR